MNRMQTAFLLALAMAMQVPGSAAAELTAREIMERVDARDDGDNSISTLEMTLIDKGGDKRVRQVTVFTKDKGRDMQRMQFFLAPADVRGTGFLTYDFYSGEKDDDQWLYLPELRKTKRIASSDKSGSFMGTDFSYADMTRRVVDEWTYKLLKEDEVRGEKVWLIEATPRDETVRDRYGYEKSVVFVRQDIFMVVRAVHWVRDGGKLKYLDMKRLELIDGIWMGTELDMKTTKGGETLHRTVMRFSNVKYNQDLSDDLFTVRRLEKGP